MYADGLVIQGGDFRPYAEARAQGFVRDVVDGYFPEEFKDR